jgi:hypothetical protein
LRGSVQFELCPRQVAQNEEMYPCVCTGKKRRVDEENPRSFMPGRRHEIHRAC